MSVPILWGHDPSNQPVGYLDDDGKTLKLTRESGITPVQLVNLEIGYIAKEIVDGVVIEAELVELSIVVRAAA